MPNEIVPFERRSLMVRQDLRLAANAMLSVTARPGLADYANGMPRTILIGRMLAGAADSDILVSTLLCLPSKDDIHVAIIGEPRGPAFKTLPEERTFRSEATTKDDASDFVDWRLERKGVPVVASFDTSAGQQLLQTIHLCIGLGIPIDVLFLLAKGEGRPGILDVIEAMIPVVRLRPADVLPPLQGDLAVPAVPRRLVAAYQAGEGPLRALADQQPVASRSMYATALRSFADQLHKELS